MRLVREPELAALRPRPIFASKLLSEPVFFKRSGGAGGTVARPAVFLCSCWSLAYCSCNAFCFRNSSWCRCSSCSCLPFLLCNPSCEFTLSQELELLVERTADEDWELAELLWSAGLASEAAASAGSAIGGLPSFTGSAPRAGGLRSVAFPPWSAHE